MSGPIIGLAIPAYRAGDFLAETLDSALGQRGVDLRVVVSNDGNDPATALAIAPYLRDRRVHLVRRRERLGWVRNTSETLADLLGLGVTHAAVLPHDDLLLPDCLARLHQALEETPGAAVAYSDCQTFGAREELLTQPSVMGKREERIAAILETHFNALPYRGLMGAEVLRRILPLPGNAFGDFAVDTAWMLPMAREGALIRVEEVLYRKRYHGENTHMGWLNETRQELRSRWIRHCGQCLDLSLTMAEDERQRARFTELACKRLWWATRWIGTLTDEDNAALRAADAELRQRAGASDTQSA